MKGNRRLTSEKMNKPDLPLASRYKTDGQRYMISYWKESHELMMRLMKILEYSNLQDLRTINDSLTEMGFTTKEESK
jgi:hypothetical protein